MTQQKQPQKSAPKKLIGIMGSATALENVESKHPPDEEQRYRCHDNIANPLARGSPLSTVVRVLGGDVVPN
jgi:hypothetical protein